MVSWVGRKRASLSTVVALAVVLTAALAVGWSSAVAAEEGAVLSSHTDYRIDPDTPAVDVTATYTMTNVSPNRDLGGGRFEYYFFTGLYVPIDPGAIELVVQVNGRDGDYSIEVEDSGYPVLNVEFGYQLRYNKTATVVVSYTLLGDPPRTEDSVVRVNPAYASFPAYGWGDPGRVSVSIAVPTGWVADYAGSDLDRKVADGTVVFEAVDIEEPDDFWVWFTARDDQQLVSTNLDVDGDRFRILSWPGDDAWRDFAQVQITDGLPVLEGLIGAEWPEQTTTDVIEASTTYLSGYAGFYDSVVDEIEAGEELDQHTMLHELAHGWFNWSVVDDRFLVEGLAEEVSARAVERLGEELPDPRTDAEIRKDWGELATFPLLDWSTDWSGDDSSEDYGYATSQRVMRTLWDEIGDASMTELLSAVVDRDRAYPGEDDDTSLIGAIGWREFLDLAEQIGGSEELDAVYRSDVLTRSAIAELDRRDDYLVLYDELVARSGTWWPPEYVRSRMARWLDPSDQIASANELLDLRDELCDVLDTIDLQPTPGIETQYQDADVDAEFTAVHDELDELIAAADELATTRDALVGQLDELGLDAPVLTQALYDEDPYGIVDVTEEWKADADRLAAHADELGEVLAGTELSVPELDASAFVDDPAATIELVADRTDAAAAVVAAHGARDDADSFVEQIGLVASEVDRDLDDLDALLAAGDLDAVHELSDQIIDDVDQLDSSGVRRLAIVGGLVALLLAGLLVLLARRRRARQVLAAATAAVGPALDPDDGPQPADLVGDRDGVAAAGDGVATATVSPLVGSPAWPAPRDAPASLPEADATGPAVHTTDGEHPTTSVVHTAATDDQQATATDAHTHTTDDQQATATDAHTHTTDDQQATATDAHTHTTDDERGDAALAATVDGDAASGDAADQTDAGEAGALDPH